MFLSRRWQTAQAKNSAPKQNIFITKIEVGGGWIAISTSYPHVRTFFIFDYMERPQVYVVLVLGPAHGSDALGLSARATWKSSCSRKYRLLSAPYYVNPARWFGARRRTWALKHLNQRIRNVVVLVEWWWWWNWWGGNVANRLILYYCTYCKIRFLTSDFYK